MIDQLNALGDYNIGLAAPDAEPPVYVVEGPAIKLYVAEDDVSTWESLLATHDERVLQLSETPDETRERLEAMQDD